MSEGAARESSPEHTPQEGHSPAHLPLGIVAIASFLLVLVPVLVHSEYGYFIDELYYLSCADRPALGYVDHPPLSVWLLVVVRAVLGDSIITLRLVSALACAITVLLTGRIAYRLGAGTWGQVVAGLGAALTPANLAMFGFYSMNALEILLWTVACAVLVEILRRDDARLWLVFGAVAGIALLNKHTFVTLGAAVAVGTVLSPARRHLATPWPWLGAGVALLLFLPNLAWQVSLDWPSLEFYRNASLYKNVHVPPLGVLRAQIEVANPGALPLWGAGLFLVCASRGRYRAIGWAYVLALAMMVLTQQSRPDRMAGLYPVLLAAGGAYWDSVRWRWPRVVLPVLLVGSGVLLLPMTTPILPPAQLADAVDLLGGPGKAEAGPGKTSPLPQLLADRFGWEAFVDDVAKVVDTLTPEERSRAAIFAPSYGHAGALERFAGSRRLPPVVSGHNTWYLWGLPEGPIDTVVVAGSNAHDLGELFEQVELVVTHDCTYCMAWRDDLPIHVARYPRHDLHEVWPTLKHYE
jgi:hypothetical protein